MGALLLLIPGSTCCRNPKCPKNYIVFSKDSVNGHQCLMQLVHFKNDSTKGLRRIPLDPQLMEPFIMLHKAREACAPHCKTLFFNKSLNRHEYEYFITKCADALSTPHKKRVTAGVCRHLYETKYREFLHQLGFKLLDIAMDELDKAAAEGMLSSTDIVSRTYDRGEKDRAYFLTQPYWPLFKEFVRTDYKAATSRQHWNFMEELPDIEGLTLRTVERRFQF